MRFDRIWLNARLATLAPGRHGLGIVERGAVAATDGRIAFAGPAAELPAGWDAAERIALDGRWVTPGLIDCHTHLVYAATARTSSSCGSQARPTRTSRGPAAASSRRCGRRARRARTSSCARRLPRLDRLHRRGRHHGRDQVGLRPRSRHRGAHAARRAPARARTRRSTSSPRFLGAHALPPEADGDKDRYIDEVCAMIPAVARERLADAVDAFCEGIAFSPAQTARVFAAAQAAGLPVKLHADQLSNLHGAQARGRARRAVGRPSRIHRRGRRRRDGTRRNRRGAAARRVLRAAREAGAAGRGAAPARRADRDRDRLQSRHLADHLAAPDHEHGGDAVPADRRGGDRRASPARRRARSGASPRSARSSRASGATSRSGTSSGRPSWSIGSASIRCTRACGAGDDARSR